MFSITPLLKMRQKQLCPNVNWMIDVLETVTSPMVWKNQQFGRD
jgi:hypothetical protein